MPIISQGDRKGWRGRTAVLLVYILLILGGVSMVYPFAVTLTGSVSNDYDYERRSPFPQFFFSRSERFMRVLCSHFPPSDHSSVKQMRGYFPSMPVDWHGWPQISDDPEGCTRWANSQLACLDDPNQKSYLETSARDYHDFVQTIDLNESILAFDSRFVAPLLKSRYKTIDDLNSAWEIAIEDFTEVGEQFRWRNQPFYHSSYVPRSREDARQGDLMALRQAYLENRYTPFLHGDPLAAPFVRPMALSFTWERYAAKALNITDPQKLHALPFPVPATADADVRTAWLDYLAGEFPLRHIAIQSTPERQAAFETFLQKRFRRVDYLNDVMRTETPSWQDVDSWQDIELPRTSPGGTFAKAWFDFVRHAVPVEEWKVRDSLAEKGFQSFALARHGSLSAVNQAYGLDLKQIEQLRIPFAKALLVTFNRHQAAFTWAMVARNYHMVLDYLVLRGRAAFNTVILIVLTLLIALTVNPLAGYALSRFRLPQTEKVLIFCLATMAFPASVAAIPGFLLLRDLGLLNTFAALVLPGAANGMAIFLLKGFFDSLPQELFEAATIDGAPEWQIFFRISLPLVKPILAVNMLNAFIMAYSGWAWAIIVCQDKHMWTMAVWTYQFSQIFSSQPFVVMAAYIVTSLPVFVVFILCQRIIMRGIILPQMK